MSPNVRDWIRTWLNTNWQAVVHARGGSVGEPTLRWPVDGSARPRGFTIAIVADGFTEGEQSLFRSAADAIMFEIFETEPLSQFIGRLNVYVLPTVSAGSGIGDKEAENDISHTTVFNMVRTDGSRLTWDAWTIQQCLNSPGKIPNYDAIILVGNATFSAGTAGAASQICGVTRDPSASRTAIHELGHLMGLGDEYSVEGFFHSTPTSGVAGRGAWWLRQQPVAPNVYHKYWWSTPQREEAPWYATWARVQMRHGQFRELTSSLFPIVPRAPGTCSEKDNRGVDGIDAINRYNVRDIVGLFEGANTFGCGAWRPQFACIMRNEHELLPITDPEVGRLPVDFCFVCRRHIVDYLLRFSPAEE
jgi:hypothetical protein